MRAHKLASCLSAIMKFSPGAGDDPLWEDEGFDHRRSQQVATEASSKTSHKSCCDEEETYSATENQEDDVVRCSVGVQCSVKESVGDRNRAFSSERQIFATAKADLELRISGGQKAVAFLERHWLNSLLLPKFTRVQVTHQDTSTLTILEAIEERAARD